MIRNPLVSVLVVTYNHEKYIAEALESILAQDFDQDKMEIVIADDVSKDKTIDIIMEYEKQFPNLIKIINNEKNVGITKNYKKGFAACTGKYVAVLEGDDYWTSPKKLSIMVDFLENNKACSMVFNRFILSETEAKRYSVQPWPIIEKFQLITVTDLVRDNFIGNFSTCMYRNDLIKKINDDLYEIKVYDWMFNIVIAQNGMIGYLPEVMSLYRLHSSGTWSQKTNEEKIKETITSIESYNEYLNFIYDVEFTEHKNKLLASLNWIENPNQAPVRLKLKNIIKMYTPPILWKLAKLLIPPKFLK